MPLANNVIRRDKPNKVSILKTGQEEIIHVDDLNDTILSEAHPYFHVITRPSWIITIHNRTEWFAAPEIIAGLNLFTKTK